MKTLEELASNEEIKKEYKKTFLLNILKKMIERMRRDNNYKQHILTLFKQSTDKIITTKIILNRDHLFDEDMVDAINHSFLINYKHLLYQYIPTRLNL